MNSNEEISDSQLKPESSDIPISSSSSKIHADVPTENKKKIGNDLLAESLSIEPTQRKHRKSRISKKISDSKKNDLNSADEGTEPTRNLNRNEWFFDNSDRKTAELILMDCLEDSFLVRPSTVRDTYAVSLFYFSKRQVVHNTINTMEFGQRYLQLLGSARLYPTLEDLVNKCPELQGFRPALIKMNSSFLSNGIAHNNSSNSSLETTSNIEKSSVFTSSSSNSSMLSKGTVNEGKETDVHTSNIQANCENEILSERSSIETLELHVQKALLKDNTSMSCLKLKEVIKRQIEINELKIQDFDKNLVQRSLMTHNQVSLDDEENEEYMKRTQDLVKLRFFLQRLRLKGDEFRIIHKGENKIFKIIPEGQILFCNVKQTAQVESLVPQDMSEYVYYNVRILEGKNVMAYEITSARVVHYLDQVQKIVYESSNNSNPNNNTTSDNDRKSDISFQSGSVSHGKRHSLPSYSRLKGICCIHWKHGKKSTFETVVPEEAEELVEVVGCHLKKFKHAAVKQIQLLKDIYRCKTTKFDLHFDEHEALLRRLWQVIMPNVKLTVLISPQWKLIGFQGNNPETDFRGMGLLGLLNLIYFAENYTYKVQSIIRSNRDYPWAVTGINITHMLLKMLHLTDELVNQPAPDHSWHTPLLNLFYYADNDDTFDELYSQSFLLFDRLWAHHNGKYMDFPMIIQQLQRHLEQLLNRKPLDIKQLIAWIEQLQISFEPVMKIESNEKRKA